MQFAIFTALSMGELFAGLLPLEGVEEVHHRLASPDGNELRGNGNDVWEIPPKLFLDLVWSVELDRHQKRFVAEVCAEAHTAACFAALVAIHLVMHLLA